MTDYSDETIGIALPGTFQRQCVWAQFSPAQLMGLVHVLQWKLEKKKKDRIDAQMLLYVQSL